MTNTPTLIMNAKQVQQRINRLAWQVYEQCSDENEIVIAGIASSGFTLAKRIGDVLAEISPIRVSYLLLQVNKEEPLASPELNLPENLSLNGKAVIVVDDVSNSGRTLMYGVRQFLQWPVKSIHTLVLVDRDHNRFPVKTNFVGLSLATTLQEHITVEMHENGEDKVFLN
jgi:pyrimidine operon attenuation protein / uracil phosphoribosyltransferase